MANPYFQFKQFTIHHDRCAMKVTTDSCFFGAWAAKKIESEGLEIQNLLDIGAGTGLLSLMIAQKNEAEIDAVEIDEETSQQANENVEASPWENRIHIFNKDILSFQPDKKYDCIISNPPFYQNELTSEIKKKNIAHHSDQLTISEVLDFIKAHLKADGLFFLLLPFKRKKEIENLLLENELFAVNTVVLYQSVKHPPFRVLIKGSKNKILPSQTETISIWDENQQYTKAFADLLKDYYLYL